MCDGRSDTNNARYISSYFDMYPGVWRHGTFVNLSVSFALAMWVALRARGVRISLGQTGALGALLLARFRANWRQFFWSHTKNTDTP